MKANEDETGMIHGNRYELDSLIRPATLIKLLRLRIFDILSIRLCARAIPVNYYLSILTDCITDSNTIGPSFIVCKWQMAEGQSTRK